MAYTSRRFYRGLPAAVQKVLVAWHGRRIRQERFGPEYDQLARFLEESERSDPGKLREYQEERLGRLIRHAYETVPYYREVMDARHLKPADIKHIEDLTKLPVLHKEDVRRAGTRLLSSAMPKRALKRVGTSATSGTPLSIWWDREVSVMNHACYMRLRSWAGFPFGAPYATMQGRPVVPTRQTRPPFWRHNPSWNQLLLSTLHLTDENLGLYVAEIRRFGTVALEAFPTCAYVLARYLETRGEYLPLSAVTSTGEQLLPHERQLIEERFQVRIFDAYSQAERIVFSSECEEHDGHHLYAEYGVTEIVDEDGHPVPAGTPGLLAGTSLHNFGMPLIRYACGDVGALRDGGCACGRTLPMLDGLTSRVGDFIVTPDGRMVPAIMVSWSMKEVPGVKLWRIIQERREAIRMLVVRDRPLEERDEKVIRVYFARRLGPEVDVQIEQVPDIPRSSTGKFRHVVSSVPLVWGDANRWERS